MNKTFWAAISCFDGPAGGGAVEAMTRSVIQKAAAKAAAHSHLWDLLIDDMHLRYPTLYRPQFFGITYPTRGLGFRRDAPGRPAASG